jgi:acyl-CoA thioesterase-1
MITYMSVRFLIRYLLVGLFLSGFAAGCMQKEQDTILFLGDSLTEGFRLSPADSFPSVVQKRLEQEGYEYRILNGGKSGNTTADALDRLPELLKNYPDIDIVVIFLGANDFFEDVPPVKVKENLIEIISFTRTVLSGVQIYIIPFPALRTMIPDYEEGFNNTYTEVSGETGVKLLPFIMTGVFGVQDMNQADGIHPNAQGARVIADNMFRILKEQNIIHH